MCEENKIEVEASQEVKGLDDYKELFLKKRNVQREALKMALDTRKFEIELYWHRATYFWAFIAVAFAAYFMVFKEFKIKETTPSFYNEILLGISLFGVFVSCCWFLVNKGAKYWQENWEKHVDLLEDDFMGPLYKTTVGNKESWLRVLNPTKSCKYSVGKINLLLSFVVLIIWLVIFFNRTCIILGKEEIKWWINESLMIVLFLLAVWGLFFKCRTTRTNGDEEFTMERRVLKNKQISKNREKKYETN